MSSNDTWLPPLMLGFFVLFLGTFGALVAEHGNAFHQNQVGSEVP